MAHAIHNYPGACKNIHGHSYQLHVSVCGNPANDQYIPAPGILVDFKEIKTIVQTAIISKFDHRLLLSAAYLEGNDMPAQQENLLVMEAEPTAENLLIFMNKELQAAFPPGVRLLSLKLFETKDSYAEWTGSDGGN
jgi:6-pyruvoyltetrahydropterin/6-carboxytetrahydropterin synthase